MKIKINKGKHFEGDRLISIQTKDDECFSLYKLLLLVNQIAFNEANKYEWALKKGLPLFFEQAIQDVVELGKQGIDLLDEKNEDYLKYLCANRDLILEKFKQTIISTFENGTKTT